jgi:hypothetical protein
MEIMSGRNQRAHGGCVSMGANHRHRCSEFRRALESAATFQGDFSLGETPALFVPPNLWGLVGGGWVRVRRSELHVISITPRGE